MRFFAVALLACGITASSAQGPLVPPVMSFAGITLSLDASVRSEIQKDVDLLTKYTRYYNMKVDRARAYFPIIEQIFKDEGVPDDFKFLVLQESALVADAVSVSQAVGFWQFKDFTALEMGMRVDRDVDERMNIISSTRGAAKYLKQSNYYFNNWLLALQAYQMGTGGVRRVMNDSLNGVKTMDITPATYWYVKKYLAHKVAFEGSVTGESTIRLVTYEAPPKMNFKRIAEESSIREDELREYNKWLKGSEIPDDKPYMLLIPRGATDQDFTKLVLSGNKISKPVESMPSKGEINSVPVVFAMTGETVAALAARGGISVSAFIRYNEISAAHVPLAGTPYFLSRKKSTGSRETYPVKPGDDLWLVSQKEGVRVKSLKKYNRLENGSLAAGSLVWLRGSRPSEDVATLMTEDAVALDSDSFDWYIKSPREESPSPEVVTSPEKVTLAENVAITAVPEQKVPVVITAADTPSEVKSPEVVITNPPVESRPPTHVVAPGETLYSIARRYDIEVTDLLNWNKLTVQSTLKPGQVLKTVENEAIESGATAPQPSRTETITHEVKASDTLYSVARQYGVTIKDIMDWNNKKDFSLTRGEKLEIRRTNP